MGGGSAGVLEGNFSRGIKYQKRQEDKENQSEVEFVNYMEKMNYLLGSNDPFMPLYRAFEIGGNKNA